MDNANLWAAAAEEDFLGEWLCELAEDDREADEVMLEDAIMLAELTGPVLSEDELASEANEAEAMNAAYASHLALTTL